MKGRYLTELVVRHIDGKKWEVMEPFAYAKNTTSEKDDLIIVKKGYITNFASIPRLFWRLIGHPAGKHGKAAVVHDYLYSYHLYSKKESDKIFYQAMRVSGVSWLKASIMFNTVKWFGKKAWKKGVEYRGIYE